MTDIDKLREQFEAAFIAHQVEAFGEYSRDGAVYRLNRNKEFERPPTAYELKRREQGMYDDYWVEMTWWAWQASRQALVITIGMQDGEVSIPDIEAQAIAQGMRVEVLV